MSQVLFLIPLSVFMGLIGLCAFIWALRHDQFDDLEGNAWRIVTTQDPPDKEGVSNDELAAYADHENTGRRL
ncbi:MAG: cbb3-type cytochrome oxidase assembly protein CcoS [Nitratireductor sp.]|nr:cbb3-type cytochrome oxidase assembly protein CcoS [Nitratireductor sp.]